MAEKKFVQDYTMVCRTCLQSEVEMLSLSEPINDHIKKETSPISYMECLKACMNIEETTDIEMPQRICLECASALQISYWFTKNASKAQELLKAKLREIRRKKQKIEIEAAAEENKKTKRYRCKICNVKVETKRSLKDHVKLHLDIIVYNCQMCQYESNNRNCLSDHYIQIHGVEATKEQLKPKTKLSPTSVSSASTVTAYECMDGAIKNELFQILPEELQQMSYDGFDQSIIETNSPCSTENLQEATAMTTANPDYTTISAPFNALDVDLNNDLDIANEFMVMADGTLEKVMNKGVVIEYIDDHTNDIKLEDDLVLENIIQVENVDNTVMLEPQNDIAQMDVDDLIIEDRGDVMEHTQAPILLPLDEETIPVSIIEQPKKVMCKICTKDFFTQEQLKNHMLTHNEIPHFFCDQCKFYTFFKIDLQQHYKSKHNLLPTNKQLQPKNKQKTMNEFYTCDLCFYEANVKSDLKTHYKTKHNIETNEIHLKPTKVGTSRSILPPLSAKAKAAAIVTKLTTAGTSQNIKFKAIERPTPDYPNGLHCRKCHEIFFWRKKLYEHYKMHNAEEAALKQQKQLIKIQNKTTSNSYQHKTNAIKTPQTTHTTKVAHNQLEISNTPTYPSLCTLALSISSPNNNTLNSVAPLTPSSSSTYTLPSDAIPQIVETDQNIENDMDFDFHCDDDALFGDFEDDVDVENDSDDNDSEFRNILLTSDDDFEDMLQDQNNINNPSAEAATTESYCAHCQKSFISQYQFENHMFVHRGLAPYRCELCTNLYNTKRCLIRHYKAVHKNVPTRDMIQAKGDKVCDDKTPMEHIKLEASTCFMCAKCPYESSELNDIKFHLKSTHSIDDDSYIMKKLPFECPRCIRSFKSKLKISRHLERNHSSTPINQHQVQFDGAEKTSAISTNTSVTSISTTTNNHENMIKSETSETNASSAYNEIFIKESNQHQHTCPASTRKRSLFINAEAPNNTIITPFDEFATHQNYNEISTNSNNSSLPNMHTFFTQAMAPTTVDENDININQPLFKCKICLLTCYNLATFNEHSKRIACRTIGNIVSSLGDKLLFECEICHCNYKTMYLLKHHLRRHIGRKFFCAICPKTFINHIELEAHKHVHNGERPHKCDVCTKSFRYVHHLKRHKDTVHFGKRHDCTEPNCGRKFTTLAQLKAHIWTHNGIVPYQCPFCNRLFKKRLLLREHCLKIHKFILSEEEVAEIFRNNLGYTNPHDFTVTIGNGKMLRRGDLETMGASGIIKSLFN